jgi:iron complex outermembrane receptor protein
MFGEKDTFYAIPSLGFRYMNHNRFDNEMTPQAGLIFGNRDTSFHASYGKGINYPGIYTKVQEELWLPGDNKWSQLKAEKLDHFEAGISHSFHKLGTVDFTWFYDKGEDRIVVSPPPPFPPVLTNIGKYRHKGLEGTVTVVPLERFSFFGGFTYLDTEPADLPYSPDWTFSTGMNYTLPNNLQISLDTLYVDNQYVTSRARQEGTINVDQVGSYFLFNGKITYNFTLPNSNISYEIYLAGENLTDIDYEQKKGYPMQGLSFMLGFVVKVN